MLVFQVHVLTSKFGAQSAVSPRVNGILPPHNPTWADSGGISPHRSVCTAMACDFVLSDISCAIQHIHSMEASRTVPVSCSERSYTPTVHSEPILDGTGTCILSSPLSSDTFKDWPLPVRQYERSHASVLIRKPTVDQSGKFIYYTYAIRFDVVEIGTDPSQQLASEFALITPGVLASEVANMSVNLYLPWETIVKSNVSECGRVALDINQVDLARRFNTWLFEAILGKTPVPVEVMPTCTDSPKGYYVLPLQSNKGGPVEFDWSVVYSSLASGLIYRKKLIWVRGLAKLGAADFKCDSGSLRPGETIMRNGKFSEEELDDAMITCAHNGVPCYVTSISKHINGLSSFPSGESYADYYARKCDYLLKYQSQSFLKGRRLARAAIYLKRQESDTFKGNTVFLKRYGTLGSARHGEVAAKANELVEVPPEVCSLHIGVKGKLCRGAMRLPSVLYSLELASMAAELRDMIGGSISCFKVLEALTSRACQGDVSYEVLEFLGDSVLKLTGCTYLFRKEHLNTQEQLGATLYDTVRNRTLYDCASARDLARYILVEPFSPSLWIPPGLVRSDSVPCPEKEQRRKFQTVSCKTLADVVEALVGAYLVDGGLDAAIRAITWLRIPIEFPSLIPKTVRTSLFRIDRCAELCKCIKVDDLECKLGYRFKDRNLLAGALKYELPDSPENSLFKRLEFLGDGIFDFIISRHLVRAYPAEDEGKFSDLKQAIRNSENLALMAVLHGLHTYLQQFSPSLEQAIGEYITTLEKEGGKAFGLSTVCAPKALGDLLQTLAAAIYLDADLDIEIVWQVVRPLLEPMATPLTMPMHPIKQLETVCVEKGWNWKIKVTEMGKQVEAEVWIEELVMGKSQNQDKKVARRLAATMALSGISNRSGVLPMKAC